MMTLGRNILDPEKAWINGLESGNKTDCISLLQIAGWELLSQYLNGGLGHDWWLFPAKLGSSKVLRERARSLIVKWQMYSKHFGIHSPTGDVVDDINVELVLCNHYQFIGTLLEQYSAKNTIRIPQLNNRDSERSKVLLRMVEALDKLQPFLLSYWFHGSVGSNEVKPGWSDFDGLAIVSEQVFSAPENLANLRLGLIKSRAFMVDFMPYQLHGHFVLAETDLRSYPSCMFPAVLFENAQCVISDSSYLSLCERFDRRMALEILWKHGIKDLITITSNDLNNTLRKIAFLHRVFLLPCLIFQAGNNPCFKRKAFEQLAEIFTLEEVNVIRQASSVWSTWEIPNLSARIACRMARPLRFNPLFYQKMSHKIGEKIQWFQSDSAADWPKLAENMRVVAGKAWQRALCNDNDG